MDWKLILVLWAQIELLFSKLLFAKWEKDEKLSKLSSTRKSKEVSMKISETKVRKDKVSEHEAQVSIPTSSRNKFSFQFNIFLRSPLVPYSDVKSIEREMWLQLHNETSASLERLLALLQVQPVLAES